jgi:hypothetical protein
MVGVSEQVISRFDSQTRYDIDVLISVSKALEVSVEELFMMYIIDIDIKRYNY